MTRRYLFLALGALMLFTVPARATALFDAPRIGDSFGVNVKSEKTTENDLTRIKNAGFGYVRFNMRWQWVETEKGVYDWTAYDKFIGQLRDRGLKPFIIIHGTNKLYSGLVDVPPEKFWGATQIAPAPTQEDALQAFAEFTRRAVDRYKGTPIVWEIWNEPDLNSFWPPKANAEEFAAVAAKACDAMRKSDPQATIVAPGVAQLPGVGIPFRSSFVVSVLQSPAFNCLDAISIHSYRNKDQIPESVIADYGQVRAYLADNTPKGQKPLPILSSEWGYTLTKVSEDQQARYALRTHLSNLLAGMPISIWYEWRDSQKNKPTEPEAHYGLATYDGTAKPSLDYLESILPLIHDAVIEKRIPSNDPSAYILSLRLPNGTRYALAWLATKGDERKQVTIKTDDTEATETISGSPRLIGIRTPLRRATVTDQQDTDK